VNKLASPSSKHISMPTTCALHARCVHMHCTQDVYIRIILHEELRPTIVRQEFFLQRLNVTLAAIPTAESIRIALHDDQLAAARSTTFIQSYSTPYHLSWLAASR
jgi:hypothetical protein